MRYLITILIFLLLFSCKNTRQITKSETEVKTSTELQSTKTEDAKSDIKTGKTIDESIVENDSTVIEETIVKLSIPDSTGQQHTESITTRVITSGKNKKTKTKTKEEVVKVTENKIVETETKKEDQVVNNEVYTKTVKKQQSWKTISLIILALIAVGFIVYKFKGEAIKNVFKRLIK